MVDVDIRNPQVIYKSDVYWNVRFFLRRIRTEKTRFLPSDAEIHGETDSELDVVDLKNLRTVLIFYIQSYKIHFFNHERNIPFFVVKLGHPIVFFILYYILVTNYQP